MSSAKVVPVELFPQAPFDLPIALQQPAESERTNSRTRFKDAQSSTSFARPSETRLYRFDEPHKTRQSVSSESLPVIDSTSTDANSISKINRGEPLGSLILLAAFFAGQFLVVWSFFNSHINGLTVGILVSVSAFGLALQLTTNRNRKAVSESKSHTTSPARNSSSQAGAPSSSLAPRVLRKLKRQGRAENAI